MEFSKTDMIWRPPANPCFATPREKNEKQTLQNDIGYKISVIRILKPIWFWVPGKPLLRNTREKNDWQTGQKDIDLKILNTDIVLGFPKRCQKDIGYKVLKTDMILGPPGDPCDATRRKRNRRQNKPEWYRLWNSRKPIWFGDPQRTLASQHPGKRTKNKHYRTISVIRYRL